MEGKLQMYIQRIEQLYKCIKIVQEQSKNKIGQLYQEISSIRANVDQMMRNMSNRDCKMLSQDDTDHQQNNTYTNVKEEYEENDGQVQESEMQDQQIIQQYLNINAYIMENEDKAAIKWVDPTSYSFKNIKLIKRKIVAKNPADIFGSIQLTNKCYFAIKIQHILQDAAIGIADARLSSNKFLNGDNFTYYTAYGYNFIGQVNKQEGKGYKIKQTLVTQVDKINGTVLWRVGDQIRHKAYFPALKNKQIQWVPLIGLGSINDIFTLIA